jgi:seryl-tRNA synthetase
MSFKKIPNIATDDTPVGHSEEENVCVKKWGKIPEFAFEPKNHYELAGVK